MKKTDVLVIGLALFAMFFGAGNLIFPPAIGNMAGNDWLLAMIGFFITGIGMPILGIIAIIKAGGLIEDFGKHIGARFSLVFGLIIVLILGPFMGVPRTGATTYEMGIAPLFPNVPMWLVITVFFALTWLLSIKQSSVVDIIGKWLTPILVALLGYIVVTGVLNPIGSPITYNPSAFKDGFTGGYQTMDLFVSIMLGAIVLKSLISKGYDPSQFSKMTVKAGLIAAVGLSVIYGGLLYLGATGQTMLEGISTRPMMTVALVKGILGQVGSVLLGVSVSFACLTTSIGITAAASEFINDITSDKIKYSWIVTINVFLSAMMSLGGVDSIVGAAGPILTVIYPIGIALVILNISTDLIKHKESFKWTVIVTGLISVPMGLSELGILTETINPVVASLPFSSIGLPWLMPALVGFAVSYKILDVKHKNRKKSDKGMIPVTR